MIELVNIGKTYYGSAEPVVAIENINLTIEDGDIFGIIGLSGAGKSTLVRCINLLEKPTEGKVIFDGTDICSLNAKELRTVRRKISMIFQSFNLLPRTTSLDNVIMPLAYTASGLSRKECRERGIEMLKRVGLSERIYHYPSQLSGGQQQRVAIARALINHPPVLFADEPTGNLDSHTSEEVMEMFSELNREGITVILVTHSTEIADFAKRSIHIQDGLVVNGEYRKGGSL